MSEPSLHLLAPLLRRTWQHTATEHHLDLIVLLKVVTMSVTCLMSAKIKQTVVPVQLQLAYPVHLTALRTHSKPAIQAW